MKPKIMSKVPELRLFNITSQIYCSHVLCNCIFFTDQLQLNKCVHETKKNKAKKKKKSPTDFPSRQNDGFPKKVFTDYLNSNSSSLQMLSGVNLF